MQKIEIVYCKELNSIVLEPDFRNVQVNLRLAHSDLVIDIHPLGSDGINHQVLSSSIPLKQGGEAIGKIKLSNFETLFVQEINSGSMSRDTEVHVSDVNYLHVKNFNHSNVHMDSVSNICFHEVMAPQHISNLSTGSRLYFINPRDFNCENVKLDAIIGKGGEIRHFYKEAIADYVWLDVYNFPEPKDWRINIQAEKFLHLSRVLVPFYATFWKNSRLSMLKSSKLVTLFDEERGRIQHLIAHLQELELLVGLKYDPADFLRSVEISLISSNLFRDAMLVNVVRQRYELFKLKSQEHFYPRYVMQHLSGFLSNFQNSVGRPLLILFVLLLTFHLFISFELCIGAVFEPWVAKYTLKTIFKPWDAESPLDMLLGGFMFALIGSLSFMAKHAYNRHSNYKW